jgi:hypothetical protein
MRKNQDVPISIIYMITFGQRKISLGIFFYENQFFFNSWSQPPLWLFNLDVILYCDTCHNQKLPRD